MQILRGKWLARLVLAAMIVGMMPGAGIAQGEKIISEITVAGNKNISTEAILSAIQEKVGVPFARDQMIADRAAIEKLGFFSVVSARDEDTAAGVKVTFEVVENPKITSIVFEGNTVFTREQLLEVMRTKEGQVYNLVTLEEQDLRAIEELYAKQTYLAYVTSDAEINPDTGVLRLPILEFRIGDIRFTGLSKTKPYVLMREMKLKPGDLFNAAQLQRDLNRIYELDILDTENYQPPQRVPSDREGYIDIAIAVTEKKTGQFTVGVGYSSLQKIVGRVELSQSNFQGKGLGVNALYEMSGAGNGASYEVGFYNPWFWKDKTSLSVRAFNRAVYRFSSSALGGGSDFVDDADYSERRKGGEVALSKPFGQHVRGVLRLRSQSVNADIAEDATPDPSLVLINQDGEVTDLGITGILDTRDFILDPATGQYAALTFTPGYARISPGDSNTFSKIEVDYRRYFSAGGPKQTVKDKRRTIAFRAQGAFSRGSLPFWEQFFAGGAERLRGYREDRFWGNKMLLASLEYRVPLGGGLGGVLFADYGGAWGEDYATVSERFDQSTSFEGHLGYGLGVRVNSPIGNLRFDYGFGDEGGRTHFSIGQAF